MSLHPLLYKLMEWVGPSTNTTDPLHIKFQVRC